MGHPPTLNFRGNVTVPSKSPSMVQSLKNYSINVLIRLLTICDFFIAINITLLLGRLIRGTPKLT